MVDHYLGAATKDKTRQALEARFRQILPGEGDADRLLAHLKSLLIFDYAGSAFVESYEQSGSMRLAKIANRPGALETFRSLNLEDIE